MTGAPELQSEHDAGRTGAHDSHIRLHDRSIPQRHGVDQHRLSRDLLLLKRATAKWELPVNVMPKPLPAVPSAAPRKAAETGASLADELPGRQCTRCGAVGTHYLTCPSLKLPPGYRLSAERRPECLCGRPAGSCEACP